MAEIPGVLRFPDGLTPGQAKGGGLSELLYDSGGNLVDHAVFHPDAPSPTNGSSGPVTWQGLAVGAAAALAAVGIRYAGVRVNRWWKTRHADSEAIVEAIAVGNGPEYASEFSGLTASGLADLSKSIDSTLDDCQDMSSREAFERLVAILIAAAFIADQMRALSNARIVDDTEFPELHGVLDRLTTQQVTDTINRMLETKSLTLDEEMSADFLALFGGGAFVENRYVPLRQAKVQEALRLPDTQPGCAASAP